MRIALDAMGTDNNPVPDVAGGILAARELGYTILLVGDKEKIYESVKKLGYEIVELDTEGNKVETKKAF